MSRLHAVTISALLFAACAGSPSATLPTDEPTSAPTSTPASTASPRSSPTSSAAPTASPTLPAWPKGIRAVERGEAGNDLGYLEYLPPNYSEDASASPLLVFLHGSGEAGIGTANSLQGVLKNGIPAMFVDGSWPAAQPFVVLMPQYRIVDAEGSCGMGDYLDDFLGFASDMYNIDSARIYLTGISCGAIGIFDYLAENEDNQVAAAVPISGHPKWAMDKAGCAVGRIPLWVFHGAKDDIVPVDFTRDLIEDLQSCTDPPPAELELTIYPDAGHDELAWQRTYDGSAGHDIYAWLLDHRLGD